MLGFGDVRLVISNLIYHEIGFRDQMNGVRAVSFLHTENTMVLICFMGRTGVLGNRQCRQWLKVVKSLLST